MGILDELAHGLRVLCRCLRHAEACLAQKQVTRMDLLQRHRSWQEPEASKRMLDRGEAHRCGAGGTQGEDRVRVDIQDKRILAPCSTEIASQAGQQRPGVLLGQVNAAVTIGIACFMIRDSHIAGKGERCLRAACCSGAWVCQSPSIKTGKQGASPELRQFNQCYLAEPIAT